MCRTIASAATLKGNVGDVLTRCNISDIRAGMVLGKALYAPGGRFLFPAGTVLGEKSLITMKSWGITEADIIWPGTLRKPSREGGTDKKHAAMLAKARRMLGHSNCNLDVVKEIERLCLERLMDEDDEMKRQTVSAASPPSLKPSSPPDLFRKGKGGPEDLFDSEVHLDSLPSVYHHIIQVINSPRSSSGQIAEAISTDVNLTARLLRLVNSPFYGFPSKVDSISRAVTLIGTREIMVLASGVSVIQFFEGIPSEVLDMHSFWKHSIATGIFSRILCRYKGLNEEQAFVAGLLHDIGRLVMFRKLPNASAAVMQLVAEQSIVLSEAEHKVIGFDHAAVGARLLQKWKFPAVLPDMVAGHHAPSQARDPIAACVVHIADTLALIRGIGSTGSDQASALDGNSWNKLGLPASVLATVVRQADRQLQDIVACLLA